MALAFGDAEAWDRFRGVNGSGVSDSSIPAKWGAENILWKVALPGVGHGSPVVWNSRIFLLCCDEKSGDRIPVCVDARTGKLLWQQVVPAEKSKQHRFNSGASSTPAVDETGVFFSWGTKNRLTIAAYTHDGQKLWDSDLGPIKGGHGFGASPIVYKNLVVLNNDQDGESSLLAVNKQSGKLVWKVPRRSKRLSYSTPCVYSMPKASGGGDVLVFTNWQHGFTGVDPLTGKVVWEKSVFNTEVKERAISSPVTVGDLVIGTCGFTANPKHAIALSVKEDGSVEEVWRVEQSVPHIPSPIVVGSLTFLWDDKGIVSCLKTVTGERIWRERVKGNYYGSPVCASGKIFCVDTSGVVSVISAEDKFELLARNDLEELCHTTPAITTKAMYIRTYKHLHAIRAK